MGAGSNPDGVTNTRSSTRKITPLLPSRSVWKTDHPNALEWWRLVAARHAGAKSRVEDFGLAVTRLIGGCDHGNARHDIVTRRTTGGLRIVGVMAEVYELENPPKGTTVHNGVLIPNLRTVTGQKMQELMVAHATDGLLDGSEEVGVLQRLRTGTRVIQPSIGLDPVGGVLFQSWPAGQDIRDRVAFFIRRSGVSWDPTSELDLARAKERALNVSRLQKVA